MGSNTRLDKGCIFDLLSNSRRRMVIFYLGTPGTEMTVAELAEAIAARENDTDIEAITYKQRKRVYVSLYQTHLPRLADAEIVRYEKDAGTVGLTERAAELESFLTATEGSRYPWHKHYLSLSLVSGFALLAHFVGVPGFETVPAIALGGAVTLTFGTSGVTQFVMSRQEEDARSMELCEDSF